MAQKMTVKQDASLLNYLFAQFPDNSRTAVKGFLSSGRILVNGTKTTAFDWPLKPGDTVELVAKGEAIAEAMVSRAADVLEDHGVHLVYEDEYLIVIEKRAGLPTIAPKYGDPGHERNAYAILTDYMHRRKRAAMKAKHGEFISGRVFIVHRLDRDTSGLLVFAKDERTKEILQSKWNESVLERKYVAVLEGHLPEESGTITSWLQENEKSLKMSSSPVDDGGQMAVTRWKCVHSGKNYSTVEFELETGRKNQIRVHAAEELHHPVAGDKKYGARTAFGGRIALHAASLVFRHPYTGEILKFYSPAPREFRSLK